MGVSANQARLMTLTARQHDLELRAQQISALKMIESMKSQSMAMDYSNALNNYSILNQAETLTKNGSATGHFKMDTYGNLTACSAGDDGAMDASTAIAAVMGKFNTITTASKYLELAKSDYDTKTAQVSASEKMLDMELTQINTEHTAIKTEYDAVKSLISDNVEKSFNVFG